MSDARRPDPSEEEAWDAIVAELSGQIDTGAAIAPAAEPAEEYDYIDAYFDEGYTPPEPPPITAPPVMAGRAEATNRENNRCPISRVSATVLFATVIILFIFLPPVAVCENRV